MSRGRYRETDIRMPPGQTHPNGLAVVEASRILGIRPSQLMGIMRRETGGSFSPDQWGGYGGRYLGLIQFSPENQERYAVRPGMSFRDQLLGPVVRYIQDRFRAAGMDTRGATTAQIYASILAGSPRYVDRADVNGSSANAVPQIERWGQEWSQRFGITDDMVTRGPGNIAEGPPDQRGPRIIPPDQRGPHIIPPSQTAQTIEILGMRVSTRPMGPMADAGPQGPTHIQSQMGAATHEILGMRIGAMQPLPQPRYIPPQAEPA